MVSGGEDNAPFTTGLRPASDREEVFPVKPGTILTETLCEDVNCELAANGVSAADVACAKTER